jgi:hypothetical protein
MARGVIELSPLSPMRAGTGRNIVTEAKTMQRLEQRRARTLTTASGKHTP